MTIYEACNEPMNLDKMLVIKPFAKDTLDIMDLKKLHLQLEMNSLYDHISTSATGLPLASLAFV